MDVCALTFRIFFLIVLQLCDSEVRVNLTAIVGSSIKFPDPVKDQGFFIFGPKTIAFAFDGALKIVENSYLNRLNRSSSGHFTLSDLKKSDAGVYTVDSKTGTVFAKFYELKIYDSLSAPVVSCVNVSESSFFLQCTVNQTEQTTLQWFKGGQSLTSTDSGELLLDVPRLHSNTQYECVVRNPAQKRNITVDVTAVCDKEKNQPANTRLTHEKHVVYVTVIVVTSVFFLLVLVYLVYYFIKKRKHMEVPTFHAQGL